MKLAKNKRVTEIAQQLQNATGMEGVGQAIQALRLGAKDASPQWWSNARNLNDGPIDLIDMFSGAGGMSAGFRTINGVLPAFRQILALDIDAPSNATLAANLGIVPVQEDVHALAEDHERLDALVARSGRRADAPLVLIGCAPCQGFSSHRKPNGEEDVRNGLFLDFVDVALHLEPDFLIIENVPELLTDRYWPVVDRAKEQLTTAGYGVHVSVHNMAEFGVPQERFRTLIIAAKNAVRPIEGTVTRAAFSSVRSAIGSLPAVSAGERHINDSMHVSATHRQSTIDTIRSVPKDGGNRPKGSGPASLRSLGERQGKAAYEDVYGRLAWDKPSITITAYSRNPASGRFVHPDQDRGLTIREAGLIQTFPQDYKFSGAFDDRFRQIGNAVPPLFATHLGLSVIGQLMEPPTGTSGSGISASLGKSFSRLIPSLKAGSLRLANAIASKEDVA